MSTTSQPPLPDAAARAQITDELDVNLGVEAGAGTGKTSVLVERVTNVLASGTATVDELVVITFTEKAAAELSTRVRDELEKRLGSARPEEHGRLLAAARDLYRCHIETIHSFATSLLRERPVEAAIDPLFEVVSGVAGGLSFDAAYETFQDRLLSERTPALDRALRRGFGLAEIRSACESVNSYRYLRPLRIPPSAGVEVAEYVGQFREIAEELRSLWVACAPGDDGAVEIVEGIIEWVERLDGLGSEAEQEFALLHRGAALTHLGRGSQAKWGAKGKEALRALQAQYRALVETAKDALRTDALLGILPEIERFVDEYERQRRRDGQPDFDDLLFWARDLLRTSQAAREYFRSRYRVLLIDEFQDTDPVQAELALLLTSDGDPPEDWRQLRPAPGRLAVVGDPKQSIYRFRRADIAVYDQVRTQALSGGHAPLSTNFRSNPQMLAVLNAVFDQVLQPQAGLQPGNVSLRAAPEAPPAVRPPALLVLGEAVGSAADLRDAEATAISGALYRAHTECWEVRDRRDGGRWRVCRWGDMAILMPARTGIEQFERALAEAGIPYRHEGARDFYRRREVRDLIWVLAAIDDPTDRLATLGALRSSAFAINDEQLVIHMAATGSLSYRSPVAGPDPVLNEALAELAGLHRMRTRLSLAETVRRVVEQTRIVEFALTRPDGTQGAANLMAIVDQARLFSAAGGGGLRPFIRHLRTSVENQSEVEIEATVAEETDDVVRIMTVHGAKGLEYPIVALANLSAANAKHGQPVPHEDQHFLHFRVGAGTLGRHGHFKTPGYDDAWAQESPRIEAERLRLLYVAATRAREHLIIPCVAGVGAATGLLGDLVRSLPDDPRLVEQVGLEELRPPSVDEPLVVPVSDAEVTAGAAEREQWLEDITQVKRLAGVPRKIAIASSRERAQGPLAAEVATFDAALVIGQGPPVAIGDAVHMVMERVSLPDARDLEQVADDVCKEGAITEDLRDVISMCRACLASPTLQRALRAGRWWREVPFVVAHEAGAVEVDRAPLMNGRVDLVFREGDELIVIDYKTDKDVTKESAEKYSVAHHAGQGEVYAKGLSTATGLTVREVVFVYCKAGVEVRLREGTVVR